MTPMLLLSMAIADLRSPMCASICTAAGFLRGFIEARDDTQATSASEDSTVNPTGLKAPPCTYTALSASHGNLVYLEGSQGEQLRVFCSIGVQHHCERLHRPGLIGSALHDLVRLPTNLPSVLDP